MQLGAFSISLAVKNLEASKAFYEKFGFTPFAGDASQNWLILKNGDHIIGLFQGMFEKNILTFNPGWDQNAQSARVVHGYPRVTAEAEGAGRATPTRGGREYDRASQPHRRGPRRQSDPRRSARLSLYPMTRRATCARVLAQRSKGP